MDHDISFLSWNWFLSILCGQKFHIMLPWRHPKISQNLKKIDCASRSRRRACFGHGLPIRPWRVLWRHPWSGFRWFMHGFTEDNNSFKGLWKILLNPEIQSLLNRNSCHSQSWETFDLVWKDSHLVSFHTSDTSLKSPLIAGFVRYGVGIRSVETLINPSFSPFFMP